MKSIARHWLPAALAMFLPGVVLAQGWTQTHAPTGNWQALAMSADGSKLVAAVYGGGIYTSTNFGGTWVSNSAPVTNWSGVASSADGGALAAVFYGGICTSQDGGATWNPNKAPHYYWAARGLYRGDPPCRVIRRPNAVFTGSLGVDSCR
jgi:hypothetical protein